MVTTTGDEVVYIMLLCDEATYWIDTCERQSALLAACGCDRKIQIFDRREQKIAKIISGNLFSSELDAWIRN